MYYAECIGETLNHSVVAAFLNMCMDDFVSSTPRDDQAGPVGSSSAATAGAAAADVGSTTLL
jgi:hypothetical protein